MTAQAEEGEWGEGRRSGEWVLYRTCLTHKYDYKKTTRTTRNKTNTSAIAAAKDEA